jgi:alpha-L-rhamnosidase
MATVELPQKAAAHVTESSGHLKKKGNQDGYTLFELPAGSYTLSAQ